MKHWYRVLLLLLLLGESARASHIVGGNFDLQANGTTPGSYLLTLSMFFDENNGQPNAVTNQITVSIFRKFDNYRMQDVTMFLQSRTAVNYANPVCAGAQSLRTTDIKYAASLSLTSAYDDEGGYYVVWERCCRNTVVNNIAQPGRIGMTFYLEFPPINLRSQPFLNSSPSFGVPNGEYICRNQPFQLNFAATDADGDLLRYSLVTPYAGFSTANNPNALPVGSSSYPEVQWLGGFSEAVQIQGNPPLSVGRESGILTVTATQLGLHVFCVLVEEFRSGRRIGAVRRDFQLLVVDCSNEPPPKPVVFTGAPGTVTPVGITAASFCDGSFVDLQTTPDPTFNYQWQRNGENIPNATGPTLRVMEAGNYTVVRSNATLCRPSSTSDTITVTKRPIQEALITPRGPTAFCVGGAVALQATAGPNLTYRWQRNGDSLQAATAPGLTVREAGRYQVWIYNATTECRVLSAPVEVIVNQPPVLRLVNSRAPATVFCEGDTVALRTTLASPTGLSFQWHHNGATLSSPAPGQLGVVRAGQYWVVATDANQCIGRSDSLTFTTNPRPVVTMDTLPPVCSTRLRPVTLVGTPAGGVFSGRGVSGTIFNPQAAGLGTFPLTYAVTNQFQCTTTVRRLALVTASPRVQLGPDLAIVEGDSVTLPAQVTAGARLVWSPPETLSATDVLRPVAFPAQTTTYTLLASLATGCDHSADVTVIVYPRLTVPQGITPNGDGVNDVWELPGIDRYPDAEIKIFNRWGSEVYSSRGYAAPFDGTQNGRKLPVATYYYVIFPNNGRPALKGTLTIVE